MDDFANKSFDVTMLGELEAKESGLLAFWAPVCATA